MKTKTSLSTLGLVAISVVSIALAGSSTDQRAALFERLQETIDRGITIGQAKGISAAVILPDGETWISTSGYSHDSVPITADTPFAAGSIAKSFTAATIHQLAQEGLLTLDDPIGKWLPKYPHIDPTIPIRLLFNHRSGLYQGTGFHYSQTNYSLLRMIIEEVTGSSVAAEYRERFFVPLGYDHAFTSPYEPLSANTAHGWWDLDGDGEYDDFSVVSRTSFGSAVMGEVFCTASELAKWAHALYIERSILSEVSLSEMLDFYSPCPGEPILAGYGLGAVWYAPDLFNGLTVWGHSGNAPGYAAASLYLPDYSVCVGFMDNTEEGDAMSALVELLDIVTAWLDANP